ncbi:MFS transporter [Desulfobacterales bacterium HSG2]|nr:MFS transporter [Desulfobacterales bacterium HSG2]
MKKSDKKIFATLCFSLFATITGVGIVVPLLPVYAHDLGAGGLYIGMIFASFSISRTFCLPYFGRRSDRKGRKPLIVAGLLGYSLVSVAFVFSDTVEALITVRFIQGIASAMIMPAVQAYVGDITPDRQEGTVMGLFNMSLFSGLSFGPVIGGMLNDFVSLRSSFLCMGALSFAAFLLSILLLPPVRSERAACRGEYPTEWKQLLRDREIRGLFLFRLAYTVCIGMIWSFLPVFADVEFSLSSSRIGILVMLGVFVSGLTQGPMGVLADRASKKAMVVIGGLIVSSAMISFRWVTGFWGLFFANLLFGIGGGMSTVSHSAMTVRKGNSTKAMGSVMALMNMSHSMGMMSGALIAGLMMELLQLRQAFVSGSFIMILGVFLFMICTGGCTMGSSYREKKAEYDIQEVKTNMKPLCFDTEPEHHSPTVDYFRYYGIHFENVSGQDNAIRHLFGSFDSGKYRLAGHIFLPDDPKGTVFLLHGYFDQTGILRHLIRFCMEQGFAVAAYDQPGHGLSTGERGEIGDFSEYVSVLDSFVGICRPALPGPYFMIGHSTGGAVAIEFMFTAREKQVFEKIILLAPLVRFACWMPAKAGYYLIRPFVRTVPSRIRASSSNPDFVEFLKNDPLRIRHVSLRWLGALYQWDKRIRACEPISKPVLIIQGTDDDVVDWKYNMPFVEKKIRTAEIKWIKRAGHQLPNESREIRSEVFDCIKGYIDAE